LLHKAIQPAMARPEVKARVGLEGADAVASTPAEFATFLRRESASWDGLVKSLGIRWE
jgi:tripartite-type tricarboxylate transporter receptor subunit TctC